MFTNYIQTIVAKDWRTLEVVVRCPHCGRDHSVLVDLEAYIKFRDEKPLIQVAFPDMSSEDRELLISGCCQQCWDEIFSDEDEL